MSKLIQKLWKMRGGVHPTTDPSFDKDAPTKRYIKLLPIPPQLIIPVQQHNGEAATLIVAPGDKVFKGQPLSSIDSGQRSAIIHAPSSGIVSEIKQHPLPHISGMSGICIFIDTDGLDQWDETLNKHDPDQPTTSQAMLEAIESAGIVGLGGAVFPSAVKLTVTEDQGIDTLIINAAECEPHISCDDSLMQQSATEVMTGIALLVRLLKAKQCLIGVEDNKPYAIAALESALNTALTDNSELVSQAQIDAYATISIKTVPTQYPSGDARQLTRIMTGIEIPKRSHSVESGVLCHNIATAHAVYEAVVLNKPLLSRVVTIAGDGVAQPSNVQALIGTPISYIIEQLGGYTKQAERMIMGGPMMGFPLSSDELPVVKASNCILVSSLSALTLSADVTVSTEVSGAKPAMPCIRCNKCAQVCPVNLLPQQLYWYARAHDFDKASEHKLADCIECGACSYVCPSYIPLVDYFRFSKTTIKMQQYDAVKSTKSRERFEFNELRKVRIKQERDEKRRLHKEALVKKKEAAAKTSLSAVGDSETNTVDLEKNTKQDAIKAAMERVKARKASIKAAENKGINDDAV